MQDLSDEKKELYFQEILSMFISNSNSTELELGWLFKKKIDTIMEEHGEENRSETLNYFLCKTLLDDNLPEQLSPVFIAILLKKNGADLGGELQYGDKTGTLLSLAIQCERWDMLDTLLSALDAKMPLITPNDSDLILSACEYEQFEFIDGFAKQLANPLRSGGAEVLKIILNSEHELLPEFIGYLIEFYCKNPLMPGATSILKFMYKNDSSNFRENVDTFVAEAYCHFLNVSMNNKFPDSFKYLVPFRCGIGKIDYEAGLTACAAISAAKERQTPFNPTLLNAFDDEPEKYFEFIAENIDHMNDQSHKFIISGDHWICGVIEIKDKKATILLVDSLGNKTGYTEWSTNAVDVFFEKGIEVEIMLSEQKRQHATSGCSVFALDDIRKLLKLPKGKLSPKLNLSMLRSTQSVTTLRAIEKHPEGSQQEFVNSKGQTFSQSIEDAIDLDPITGKRINTRIEQKLDKLAEKVERFVDGKSDEQIQEAKQQFTLDAFMSRVENKLQKRMRHTKQ